MSKSTEPVPTPLFRRHARRPRLTALLDETTAQTILLTAPAGYGKTTLAREWAQGRERVAWYTATPAAADLAAFSADLADTLATFLPGTGERLRKCLRGGGDHHELARPLAEILADDLAHWPDEALVVVDDYHLVAESAPVEEFLDRLLALTSLRLLVTTRRRPTWATSRRLLHGETVEIGHDHLAMTTGEAETILADRPTEAVADLVRRAGGWPAVIGLAAVSTDLDLPHDTVADALYRYLAEEVLRREPPDVQRFMLLASVPAVISERIAREALDLPDAAPTFRHLHDEDLLHQGDQGEFRFHPLLREFLRHRFREDDETGYTGCLERVARDARTHERWDEAFTLTLELGRPEDAAEIAGQAARTLLAAGQRETLEKWLDACGPAGVTVPGAALARAELLFRNGELIQAAALAEETLRRLPDDHPDLAWGSLIAGQALRMTGNEETAHERLETSRRAARSDDVAKDALWGLAVIAAELAPDTIEQYLDELESRYGDDVDARLRIATGRRLVAESRGSIAGEWPRFQALLPSLKHAHDPRAASSLLSSMSWLAVARGRFELGRDLAVRSIRLATELRADYYDKVSHVLKAAAEIGLHRLAEAERSLHTFERSNTRREFPHARIEGLRRRAQLLATGGSLAEAIATRDDLPASDSSPRGLRDYLGTLSIIHAAAGDIAGARKAAATAKARGFGFEAMNDSALGETIALGVDGDAGFQERAVEAVLACGRADHLEGLVLAYRLHPPLLQAAHHHPEAHAILRTALTHSRDHQLARRHDIDTRPTAEDAPLPDLTPRETEVLALLAQGLTNGEIAKQLYITSSTAKVHVHRILAKLGVRNRLQAVLRAQELLEIPGGKPSS